MAREHWFARGFLAVAAMLLAFAMPTSAQGGGPGGWEFCNQTSFVVEAATGRPDGKAIIVEGWTRLRPGECRLAIDGPMKPGIFFFFARSSSAHRGGQRTWKGDVPLCVDPNGAFAVESPNSCTSMGLEQRGFEAYNITKPSGGTVTFKETEPFNKGGQSAVYAGIQRLLDDAGVFSVPMVDGYLGRESRAAITAFLNERKLPANLAANFAELTDILEDVARNRSLDVGMLLCNRTSNKIEAAIARRIADGWESRGWWTLDAGACVRAVDESLIGRPHYVFAEMETPQGVRRLSGAETVFCTSRSKFAVLGNENCEARRYRQNTFFETAVPEDGKLVYEFFERAFGPPQRRQP
jgi:uncharacterized membrane protein